jgi:hypothetical protein
MLAWTMFAKTTDNFSRPMVIRKGATWCRLPVWSLVWSSLVHQHFCRFGMLAVGDKVLMGLDRGRCAAAADADS